MKADVGKISKIRRARQEKEIEEALKKAEEIRDYRIHQILNKGDLT